MTYVEKEVLTTSLSGLAQMMFTYVYRAWNLQSTETDISPKPEVK